MASSVNAKLLAACRGFIRFGSGLVAPAVTLAACARRANRLLPPNEGCESRRSAAGTYQPSHFRHPIRGANIGEKSVQNGKINGMCRRLASLVRPFRSSHSVRQTWDLSGLQGCQHGLTEG